MDGLSESQVQRRRVMPQLRKSVWVIVKAGHSQIREAESHEAELQSTVLAA
jgi:hypothetical protein